MMMTRTQSHTIRRVADSKRIKPESKDKHTCSHITRTSLTLRLLNGTQWDMRACIFNLIITDMHGVKHTFQAVELESMKKVKEIGGTFLATEDGARSAFRRPHGSMGVPVGGTLTGQLPARDRR